MKMFRLGHTTMNVCQRNVARFAYMECRFDKIKDMFKGLGSLVSLRLQKDGGTKSKQIWTNLSHWNAGGQSSCCEELFFFNLYATFSVVTAIIYYYITTWFHYAKRDSRLSAYGGVMYGKNIMDILAEILIFLIFL